MKRRGRALRHRYGRSKSGRKQASLAGARHVIHNANPGDKSWTRHNYVFAFGGPYSSKYVRAWANSLDDALDEAVDWLSDHAPGLLCDKEVGEEYERLIAEGKSEEEAMEEAEMDTTPAGGYGQRIRSEEWSIVAEDPSRERVLQIQGRAA